MGEVRTRSVRLRGEAVRNIAPAKDERRRPDAVRGGAGDGPNKKGRREREGSNGPTLSTQHEWMGWRASDSMPDGSEAGEWEWRSGEDATPEVMSSQGKVARKDAYGGKGRGRRGIDKAEVA